MQTPSSVFYLGSVSKQFVTYCILLLEEKGKLDLDDHIQKLLPDFPVYESPLTIRHFIHQTICVRDYLTLMYLLGRNYIPVNLALSANDQFAVEDEGLQFQFRRDFGRITGFELDAGRVQNLKFSKQ